MSDFIQLLKEAEEIVKSKPTYKRFIDGTPLSNDIAVWMAEFAMEQHDTSALDESRKDVVDAERERLCAAIKAEDDYCVTEGDYMLDSDDCISVIRGTWKRPDYTIDAAMKGTE